MFPPHQKTFHSPKGSFIYYVRKFSKKLLFLTRPCANQGVTNISFSENFAYVLNEQPPMKISFLEPATAEKFCWSSGRLENICTSMKKLSLRENSFWIGKIQNWNFIKVSTIPSEKMCPLYRNMILILPRKF